MRGMGLPLCSLANGDMREPSTAPECGERFLNGSSLNIASPSGVFFCSLRKEMLNYVQSCKNTSLLSQHLQ